MSDADGPVWHAASSDNWVRPELAAAGWVGLGRAGFQHLMSTSADTERDPAVLRIYRTTEPPNRQHRHQNAEGEGEWNARKHGGSKRRVWRKIHIGIDEETLEVRAVEVIGSNIGDAPMLPELLNQITSDQDIGSVTVDGAYDTRKCHETIAARDAHAVVRHARMQSPRNQRAPEQLLVTMRSMRNDIWAAPCGDAGADTTVEAASKPKCTVSNYSANR